MIKKSMLIILDGWGLNPNPLESAIEKANTPFIDSLYAQYPHSTLVTYGAQVGLPEGQMGNSEVGHMNLGAGRIVDQDLMKINKATAGGELDQNPALLEAIAYAQRTGKKIHLLGLISNGGIHSHYNHTMALTSIFARHGLENVFVHAFTDGRDTDPRSGMQFLSELETHLRHTTGKLASITGRYYAMDRDTRWERTAIAYHALVNGVGTRTMEPFQVMKERYETGQTDEFILPIVKVDEMDRPLALISEGDVVFFTNFRSDRARQLTSALTQVDYPAGQMTKMNLFFLTMRNYDDDFRDIKVVFNDLRSQRTMGEVVAQAGLRQLRIAETEKYPHVTYFFNNGREEPFLGEDRIMVPSPRDVPTYDLKPEMSAHEVTDRLVKYLADHDVHFVCLNFANPDMVGHTGNFEAAVKACEVVDVCTKRVVEAALEKDFQILIIADHGNADYLVNEDGTPNTNHSKFPVPFILVSNNPPEAIRSGKLGDIAPTLLALMNLEIPVEMTGEILIYP